MLRDDNNIEDAKHPKTHNTFKATFFRDTQFSFQRLEYLIAMLNYAEGLLRYLRRLAHPMHGLLCPMPV